MANEKVNKVVLGSEVIIDLTNDTVSANNLLAGATAHDASGSAISGSMPNQGTKTASLNAGQSYTIPQGYHSGSGVVTANSLASQTVGTATANDIASGLTAWVNGTKLTGTATVGGATITVTYDSSFYNKTITCSNGSKTYTKTTTSSGSTEFKVSDEGTWTITCNGVSVSLDVTLNYATQMRPTGSTATPVNDIQTWLKCGGIFNKTYTTINQVLADTTTLLALISDNNAVDYMVRSTNWANSVCANATAMTDIGANNYCANTLLANTTWCNAICNSTYFESVLNVKVPVMTSDTAPSGTAFASTERNPAYYAFDGNDSTYYGNNENALPCYVGYVFTSTLKVAKVYIKPYYESSQPFIKNFKIQGSNDGFVSDVNDLYTGSFTTSETEKTVIFARDTPYTSYRLYVSTVYNSPGYASIKTLQFYGHASS